MGGRLLACAVLLTLAACAGWAWRPSEGTGVADRGATQGFGLEASPYRAR